MLDENYSIPDYLDEEFKDCEEDNMFFCSVLCDTLTCPNHKARQLILKNNIKEYGKAAWFALLSHYDNETIGKSVVS